MTPALPLSDRWREFVTALLLELRTVGSAPSESVIRELRR